MIKNNSNAVEGLKTMEKIEETERIMNTMNGN
jgi:hypothetical protein